MLQCLPMSKGPSSTLLIIIFTLLIQSAVSIHQTQPIKVNPNTESSPSNFIFYFALN